MRAKGNDQKEQTDKDRRGSDDSYRHVLRYTGMFSGVQVMKIGVDVVRNKLAAVLLRTGGFGLNGVMMNIGEVVNSLTNLGIGFSSVQRLSELYGRGAGDEEARRLVCVVRTYSFFSAVLGCILCLALSVLMSDYYFGSSDRSHLPEIALLSLFVASLPIEAGECSILKGARRLGQLATVELLCTVSTFVFTIPVFWLLGLRGIVISLVMCGWAKALLHLWATTRLFPYRLRPFSRQVVREGWPLVKRGVPYMMAAIAGSATTAAVLGYCLRGDTHEIGLYKAAYGLMVTYAGMVFTAVEADYFPRLSSVNRDRQRMNHTINQQIDVCVLLMAPLLICFVVGMPWAVRLLYTGEFLPIVEMAQVAAFYMFFKAVTSPVAYTSLARGDSLIYLLVECVYNVVFVALLYVGYHHWGLLGAGMALSLAALFDLFMIGSLYNILYHFRLRLSSLRLIAMQGVMLLAVVVASTSGVTSIKYCVALPMLVLSAWLSWRVLSGGEAGEGTLR